MNNGKKGKVIAAIDSFKGCLTSKEANAAVESVIEGTTTIEVSDGGEGMLSAFSAAWGAKPVEVSVHDALMRRRKALIAVAGDTAIIEVAQAVGLTMIEPERRNPLTATSYGVGEMVAEALNRGCLHLIIGLGGTATSDCGIGMMRALTDRLTQGGTADDLNLDGISVTLATDVDNPLLGPNGAAAVFAPQKGADNAMVKLIEHRAATFARIAAAHCHHDASQMPGAGAAGGLGYAFLQFFNAKTESGADMLLRKVEFDKLLTECSLVITGEGSADRQTLMGKLPSRILSHCVNAPSKPEVWLIAGRIEDKNQLTAAGFQRVENINGFLREGENPLDKSVASRNIQETVKRLYYSSSDDRL